MAHQHYNYTYRDEHRYRTAERGDDEMIRDALPSFSDPYHHDYRTQPRPPLSSRRQYRSEYITRRQPSKLDYIAAEERPRRYRDSASRSYAADYIDGPHERYDDHISSAPYNGSASTSTNTYIEPNEGIYHNNDHDQQPHQVYGFCQPISTKQPIHQRHTSMPSFSTPYSEQFPSHHINHSDEIQPDNIQHPPSHHPKSLKKEKSTKSKSKSKSKPRRNRTRSPESYTSDFQSFSSIPTKHTAPKAEYGSDFEPLFSAPRDSSRMGRNAYLSDTQDMSRSSSSRSSSSSSSLGSDHSGIQFSKPVGRERERGSRRREYSKVDMLGSDEDEDDEEGERGSGASSDEFASDVDFRVKGKSKWDSRSSLERSDYVADSVDESDSEAEGSGSGSEDDSEDDSEGEYMVFRGR